MSLTFKDVIDRFAHPSVIDSDTYSIDAASALRIYIIDGTLQLLQPSLFTGFLDLSRITASLPEEHFAARIDLPNIKVRQAVTSRTSIVITKQDGSTLTLDAVAGVGLGTLVPFKPPSTAFRPTNNPTSWH